jgi:hypothetical protein
MSAPPVWHNVGDTNDFLYPTWSLASTIIPYATFNTLFGTLSIAKDGYLAYITGCVAKDLGGGTVGVPDHGDVITILPRPYWPSRGTRQAIAFPVMTGEPGTPPNDQSDAHAGVFGTDGSVVFWRTVNTVVTHDYVEFAHSWLTDVDGE